MKNLLKTNKNKKIASLCLGILCIFGLFAGTFAWFTGSFTNDGVKIKSGKLDVTSNAYKYNPTREGSGHLMDRLVESGAPEGQDLVCTIGKKESNNLFVMVERAENSIDIDYLITLTCENGREIGLTPSQIDEQTRYLGGFWYKFREITENVDDPIVPQTPHSQGEEVYTPHEDKLLSYIEYATPLGYLTPDPTDSKPFSGLYKEQYKGNLSVHTVTSDKVYAHYYVLQYGFLEDISLLADRDLQVRVSVDYAQLGGLNKKEGEEGTVWSCSSLLQLQNAVRNYLPGDTISCTGNITYDRDLIFKSPVTLKVYSGTLYIKGNLTFAYDYEGDFAIDTSAGGYIYVLENNAGGSTTGGGHFEIDTPNANFEIIGKGKASKIGDIFVRYDDVTVNCSYGKNDYDDGTLQGLSLYKCNIFGLDASGKAITPTKILNIYFKNDTCIKVNSDTEIGGILPSVEYTSSGESAPEFVKIFNYGNIDVLNFSSMNYVASTITKPQIRVQNYGYIGIESYQVIDLPSWCSKWIRDGVTIEGNTSIRQEFTSNLFKVNCPPTSQYPDPFNDDDIERDIITEYIQEIDDDPTRLYVYYCDHNDTVYSLKDIFMEHFGYTSDTQLVEKLNSLTELRLNCNIGNPLQDADFTNVIQKCINLTTLDMADAHLVNNTLGRDRTFHPFGAYDKLTKVTTMIYPNTMTTLGTPYFIPSSLVREITFPAGVTFSDDYRIFDAAPRRNEARRTDRNIFIHVLNPTFFCWMSNRGGYIFLYSLPFEETSSYDTYYRNRENYSGIYWFCDDGIVSPNYEYVYKKTENGNKLIRYFGESLPDNIQVDTMKLDDENTIEINEVGWEAYSFLICSSYQYQSVSFGPSCTHLCESAFVGANVKHFDLNNLEKIEGYAFRSSKASSYDFGETLKYIGKYCFRYNYSLVEADLNNVSYLGDRAFSKCYKLEVVYCKKIYEYGVAPFEICSSLSEIYSSYPEKFVTGNWSQYPFSYVGINLHYVYLCGELSPTSMLLTANYTLTEFCSSTYVNNYPNYEYNTLKVIAYDEYHTQITEHLKTSKEYVCTCRFFSSPFDPETGLYKYGEQYLSDDTENNFGEYLYGVKEIGGNKTATLIAYYNNFINASTFNVPGIVNHYGEDLIVDEIWDVFTALPIECTIFNIPNSVKYINNFCCQKYLSSSQPRVQTFTEFNAKGVVEVGRYFLYGGKFGSCNLPSLKKMGDYSFCGETWYRNDSIAYYQISKTFVCDDLDLSGLEVFDSLGTFGDYTYSIGTVHLDSLVEAKRRMFYYDNALSTYNNCRYISNIYADSLETINYSFCSPYINFQYYTVQDQPIVLSLKSLKYVNNSFANNIYIDELYAPNIKEINAGGAFNRIYYSGDLIFDELEITKVDCFGIILERNTVNKISLAKCTTFYGTWENNYTCFKEFYAPNLVTYTRPISPNPALEVWYTPKLTSWGGIYSSGTTNYFPKLTDIYIGQLNINNDFVRATQTANNIFICGTGVPAYHTWNTLNLYTDFPHKNVNVYCNEDDFVNRSSKFPSGYSLINVGTFDPSELYYNYSGSINLEGKDLTYPEYRYLLREDGAYLYVCYIPSFTTDEVTFGGTVEVKTLHEDYIETRNLPIVEVGCAFARSTISSQRVVVDSSVKKVTNYAFRSTVGGEKTFSEITFNNSSTIGKSTCDSVTTLQLVNIGTKVSEIYKDAFSSMSTGLMVIRNKSSFIPSTGIFPVANTVNIEVEPEQYLNYQAEELWNNVPRSRIYTRSASYYDSVQNINFYYYALDDGTLRISYCETTGCGTEVTIPSYIPVESVSTSVTEIDSTALISLGNITKVTLPDNLKYFAYNRNLEPASMQTYVINNSNTYYSTVNGVLLNGSKSAIISYPKGKIAASGAYTIPATVNTITSYAFADTVGVSSIIFTSDCKILPYGFYNSSVTNVTSATSLDIGTDAFKKSTLSTLTITGNGTLQAGALRDSKIVILTINGNAIFGNYALSNSLIETLYINGTADISSYALYNCLKLTSVTINDDATIGSYAFSNCQSIAIDFLFEQDAIFESHAFDNCQVNNFTVNGYATVLSESFVNAIKFGQGTIGFNGGANVSSRAFDKMGTTFTTITFGANTVINADAFYASSSLKYITFTGVATIESYAFNNCSQNMEVTFTSTSPSTFEGVFTFGDVVLYKIFVPESAKAAYIANVLYDNDVKLNIFGY